jgi:hypothetical protein
LLYGRGLTKEEVVVTNVLIVQPVVFSIKRDTARAANTMVRWGSIESRVWC